jgi:hypothetical protein
MFATLAYRFDLARTYIPDALIGCAEAQKVRAIAHHLPASLSSDLLFECRLGADAPQVDFSLGLDPDAWAAQHEAAGGSAVSLSDRFAALRPVQSLCDAWTTEGTPLHDAISAVSLEYDAPETQERRGPLPDPARRKAPFPVPAVFMKIRSPGENEQGPGARQRTLHDRLGTAVGALFPGTDTPRPFDARLRHCVDALPERARLTWVARMLSRDDNRIRMCVSRMDARAIKTFLDAIRWPGDSEQVSDQARELESRGAKIMLAFDLGEDVGKRLGLELRVPSSLPSRGLEAEASPYASLLTYFHKQGLCTEEKRRAGSAWCGAIRTPGVHADTAALFFHNELMKLVYRPYGGKEVKLYPGIRHRDLTRN